MNLQAYLTRDVVEQNDGGSDTRGWLRAIVPLYRPGEAAPAEICSLTSRY